MKRIIKWIGTIARTATLAASLFCPTTADASEAPAEINLWGKPELESGKVQLGRDETTAADAVSAFLLDMSEESTKGAISRALLTQGGDHLTVSARLKLGKGMKAASLNLNLIGGGADALHPIATLNEPGDWQTINKGVIVPQGVGMIFLHLNFEGHGKLWVDKLQVEGALDTAATSKLNTFAMPPGYAFGSFADHVSVADGVAHIEAAHGRGGAGFVANADLGAFASHCPVLSIKQGPKNKAARLRLSLDDVEGNRRAFEYDISKASTTELTRLTPVDGWAVSPEAANEIDRSFQPGRVKGHLLLGDWTDAPLDVFIREIALAEPTAKLLALRRAKVAEVARKLERERLRRQREAQAREKILADGADHPEDGPVVQHVCTVAPDILAVTIQERSRTPRRQIPYRAEPGDEIRVDNKGHQYLAWNNGKPAAVGAKTVWRKANNEGKPEKLGTLVDRGKTLAIESQISGTPITAETLEEPRAYRVRSNDGKVSTEPVAVFRKSKPLERADNGQSPIRHVIYLKLHQPLRERATYTIRMHGVNTRQAEVPYTHNPRRTRSETLHVSHVGFRPSDPLKKAYLSIWLGTGGKHSFDVDRFELLDAKTGRSVYQGVIELAIAADQPEMLRPEKNHNRTDVYHLDFSEFSTPGDYRVFVPSIGVSYPFPIAEDVWLKAFRTSMRGLLSHRSGIELGPPLTDYRRPRPFHPDDGVGVYLLDITMLEGESASVDKAFRRLLGPALDVSALKEQRQAWGGYMDAGDWDRRSLHIRVSHLQLELLEMFPEFFERAKLALPSAEADNRLPDLLDEALWNIEFYRRLQRSDGGVGGGVESTAHPRSGETSWQESLLIGAFAPDPASSYRYAAAAAKVSGILDRYGPQSAAVYRDSAQQAWSWAERNGDRVIRDVRARGGKVRETTEATVADDRALAAVELYRLTGETTYDTAFRESSPLSTGGDPGWQLDATFAYAALPTGKGDAKLKQRALAWLTAQAGQALAMSTRNGFNIGSREKNLPMMGYVGYYSTPETAIGPVLPRLHYLTGDEKYLRGALAVTQYTVGANPMNATMTTGLGHDYPRAPLHVDSRTIGCNAPRGITIYGPHDPTKAPGWVKTWVLGKNMVPASDEWPASEFHVDVSAWPEMSEYTVHQSIGPTGYYWGYLAARRAQDGP